MSYGAGHDQYSCCATLETHSEPSERKNTTFKLFITRCFFHLSITKFFCELYCIHTKICMTCTTCMVVCTFLVVSSGGVLEAVTTFIFSPPFTVSCRYIEEYSKGLIHTVAHDNLCMQYNREFGSHFYWLSATLL